MTPINHLRNRIDELAQRVEQARESGDTYRVVQECSELERAIQVHEEQLRQEVAEMEAAKSQLHRLGQAVVATFLPQCGCTLSAAPGLYSLRRRKPR